MLSVFKLKLCKQRGMTLLPDNQMTSSSNVKAFAKRKLLYIGTHAAELAMLLEDENATTEAHYKEIVYDAFLLARAVDFDLAIVDQRGTRLATKLVLPVLSSLERMPPIVVICEAGDVGHYLGIIGVVRVLAAPVKVSQLRRAIGSIAPRTAVAPEPVARDIPTASLHIDDIAKVEAAAAAKPAAAQPAPQRARVPLMLFNLAKVKSQIAWLADGLRDQLHRSPATYASSAVALPGILLAATLMTANPADHILLTSKHAAVVSFQKDLDDLRVKLDLVNQRLAQAKLDSDIALRDKQIAQTMTDYISATVATEISNSRDAAEDAQSESARLAQLRKIYDAFAKGKKTGNTALLVKARLVDRQTLAAGKPDPDNAKEVLTELETAIAARNSEESVARASLKSLEQLQAILAGGSTEPLTATTPKVLYISKQALEAKAALDTANRQIAVAERKHGVETKGREKIETQISELEVLPIAAAAKAPTPALFVPIGRAGDFQTGTILYSCKLGFVWCSEAGTVGRTLSHNSTGSHPWFGYGTRGVLVEIRPADSNSHDGGQHITHETVYANKPPFFI